MSPPVGEAVPVALLGLAVGVGLVGVASALLPRRLVRHGAGWIRPGTATPPGRGVPGPARPSPGSVGIAVVVGIACGLVTGWPVAGVLGACAAFGLPRLLRQTSATASIATLESVATWTELLQGTLAASAGLGQAIVATAELSPPPIRPATRRLAAQIQSGVEPRTALLRFADDVADPCADRVVCSLVLAFTERAQRLGDLLGALAESTREEVALRLRVETSRASVRSGVRTVVVFSVAFAAGLAVVARSYLAPFGTPTGQLALAMVGGLYAAGLMSLVALARPPRSVRLLGPDVEER